MKIETRTVFFDELLKVEAYNFKGISQKFPLHFHETYVIGFIKKGNRLLTCKNKKYTINTGDIIFLNPRECHICEQIDSGLLDYSSINISPEIMKKLTYEVTQKNYLPNFSKTVIYSSDLFFILKDLYNMITQEIYNSKYDLEKEELFLFLIKTIIEKYTDNEQHENSNDNSSAQQIKKICEFIENNYSSNITLEDLSTLAGLSKYHLLRSFTKEKGISPHRYLANIRIDKAKKLLEQQVSVCDTALQTGFSDQSHFTNFFKKFIGITPKQYRKIFRN